LKYLFEIFAFFRVRPYSSVGKAPPLGGSYPSRN
jgi:hypothetical protein